ncbi:glycoside hydrolase family 13 protein [Multifurca ochricompacta]|uniref:Glycoside hydrolase family 13 protein n=1 Tax=Multifurca ochricompacta TaxID=376703 RepID=A0AAD4M8T4_9AGAM|nr:glycoside hydrolase family 13 protein [Multifurca ochricompacta]
MPTELQSPKPLILERIVRLRSLVILRSSHKMLSKLVSYFQFKRDTPGALTWMSLGPDKNSGNALMVQFFTWDSVHPDMSWWMHFQREVPQLAELGVTQVWLPPPNKASSNTGQGYDAYDLWDLGEFHQKGTINTRWGSKDELLSAIAVAKQHGIDVLIDAVLNHKVGADRIETFDAIPVDNANRLREIGPIRQIEGWTAFDFSGRSGKYSKLCWNNEHFTGIDWDHRTQKRGVYKIVRKVRKGWSPNVDNELGNYDYLLGADVDFRHPDVQEDMANWSEWILRTTGGSGFRLDAIKHIDRKFLLQWIKQVRRRDGRSRAFMVAEYWSAELARLLPWVHAFQGQTTFFDVPLHDNFHRASKGPFDLRCILDKTLLKTRPYDAVTFVDNHDTQIGQSLESWVDASFKLQAYSLILLRGGGHPCVFYGDLYQNGECYNESVAQGLRLLLRARKDFAYGSSQDYFEHPSCIGFVRLGDASRSGCVVLISNDNQKQKARISVEPSHSIRMKVGEHDFNTEYIGLLEPHKIVKTTADGWGTFTCRPGSLEVWIPHIPAAR